ncbi:MAG: phytoene desaturase family protein [Myxococcota bacterium]
MSETRAASKKVWSKAGKPGPWDTIVIGSGMGGMTTAAMLASFGERVLVLEQHYVPGGYTHMFKRPGYSWDVGVHAVGEVTRHTMTGRLLDYLTDGELKWASLGSVYEQFHFPDEFRIDFPDNPHQFRENLVAAFPDEAKAIDAYLDLVREVAGAMRGYYLSRAAPKGTGWLATMAMARKAERFFQMRTEDVVASLTDNPKLRALFTAQWGYYGSTPSRSSFAIQALVVKHFMHGGYYPVGGAREIAKHLLSKVADAGGWTRVSTDVDEILIEGGRAVGVRLVDGEELRAGRVVSAAGILATVRRLLPEEVSQQPWVRGIEALPPSPPHVCLYLGFKGDIRSAGCSGANKWFYDTWNMEQDRWGVDEANPVPPAEVLYCSFPSLKDPHHDPGPEQRHTGEIVTFVPWSAFERWRETRWKRRGEAYDTFKARMSEQLLKQFFTHLPELEPMLDFAELSTPITTDFFVRPVEGAIYGIEPTPERFACPDLKPRSPIPGLFFSGSDVASVGVIGAMMGGVLCATAARPRAAMKLLRQVG